MIIDDEGAPYRDLVGPASTVSAARPVSPYDRLSGQVKDHTRGVDWQAAITVHIAKAPAYRIGFLRMKFRLFVRVLPAAIKKPRWVCPNAACHQWLESD
jgi:hypothetical protein